MQLPIQLSKDSREPIYHQIEQQIKTLIASGQLQAGTPLPSIRVLSKDLEISVITTRRVYQNLENNGFIKTVQGKGTFVSKVEDALKKEVKITSVQQAFEQAIDIALHYNYTDKQMKAIFHDVLSHKRSK
ncbi:GntR family transcriptional regulator [Virgibacillus sp. W0181]|uniref:GntR family transcriptional regulator n=1 Tax=Virgibacillus sp. W0181 TaxID=3391581 RepID=UPI003F483983